MNFILYINKNGHINTAELNDNLDGTFSLFNLIDEEIFILSVFIGDIKVQVNFTEVDGYFMPKPYQVAFINTEEVQSAVEPKYWMPALSNFFMGVVYQPVNPLNNAALMTAILNALGGQLQQPIDRTITVVGTDFVGSDTIPYYLVTLHPVTKKMHFVLYVFGQQIREDILTYDDNLYGCGFEFLCGGAGATWDGFQQLTFYPTMAFVKYSGVDVLFSEGKTITVHGLKISFHSL
jgi:hypothetical protein